MKNQQTEKTNVMRIFDQKKVVYTPHCYLMSGAISGVDTAAALNEPVERVFKTLVTVGHSRNHYVFLVPVDKDLDLKKAASAVNEKSIEMIKSKDLLGLTGYIHGGCSPVGMKKQFPTFIHDSALSHDFIYVSAGQRGLQLKVSPTDLASIVRGTFADLT